VRAWLEGTLGLGPVAQGRLLATLITIVSLGVLRWLSLHLLWRRVEDARRRYYARKAITYAAVAVGVVVMSRIWFTGVRNWGTFLGLVSAGLAIALKDLVANIAGWAFILWRRPFDVGDRIEIGPHAGDVIDLRLFQFTLLEIGHWVGADQSTGRIVHIPNGRVLTDPLANFNKAFRYVWDELPVLITFESDWRHAKALLEGVATKHAEHLSAEAQRQLLEASRRFMIFYTKLTPIVYTSVQDSGVLLTLRYLCDPRQRRGTAQAMWEDILTAFAAEPRIDFAYPTTRLYDNAGEGKPGTRPAPAPTRPA